MHEGKLDARELQRWVLNRYYYQTRIPIKDALILVEVRGPGLPPHVDPPHPRPRRRAEPGDGRPRAVAAAGRGVGLDRDEVASCRARAARRALRLRRLRRAGARASPLVEAVASSLTEFFAPDLMSRRIAAWEQHYPWVGARRARRTFAPASRARGATRRRRWPSCVAHATTRELQEACVGGAGAQDRDPLAPARLRARRDAPARSRGAR